MVIPQQLVMKENIIHFGVSKSERNIMLVVKCNKNEFIYDIHSLVKAFYPAEDVKVFMEGEKQLASDNGLPEIFIYFEDNRIKIEIVEDGLLAKKEDAEAPDIIKRAEYKNVLKQLIYKLLSDYCHRKLPWGTLTGIRPTKIAYGMLEENKSEDIIFQYMKNTYYASEEKTKLAIDIAKRERKILSHVNYDNGYSLYIGIPFCPTTCLYCSFTSFPICIYKDRVSDYLTALEKEILFVKNHFFDKVVDSVYIGGGTPTTLEPDELSRLLRFVKENIDFSNVKEFTVEAGRADSITREKLNVLKQYGVTRISVNPQTMKEETLQLIGRKHTVSQVKEAFCLAREIGFENINMDLILGLPNETLEDVKQTLKAVKELNPDSITVHSLAIKRASRLNQWIEQNGITCMNNTDETVNLAAKYAKSMNMMPYYLYRQKNMSGNFENVGYARDGKFGLYNILIMEEVQTIIACGAGTITKRVFSDGRIERCDNVKDVALYIEKIDEMIERKRKLFTD